MSVSAHCFSQKKLLICLRQFRKTIRYGSFEPKTTILAKESHDPFARIFSNIKNGSVPICVSGT